MKLNSNKIDRGNVIIHGLIKQPSPKTMKAATEYCKANELSDTEIFLLAKGFARSGKILNREKGLKVCDIPSTGGPSSLSTIICPLLLKLMGDKVLKLGVPGRPAGGIDVLAQIRGFNITPTKRQINKWINEFGYVHFVANKDYAPLDAEFFIYRKKYNAVDIPSFVIASILAKKIAVNIKYVGLDARVSSFSNFGKSIEQARSNCIRFNKIASMAGIKSRCFITNGFAPSQPYIGRGESLLALEEIFQNNITLSLKNHISICFSMAHSISEKLETPILSIKNIKDIFHQHIVIQGGSMESFYEIAYKVKQDHLYNITSENTGIMFIDLFVIRQVLVDFQKRDQYSKPYSDSCGIILKIMTNQYVQVGDLLCTYRCAMKHHKEFEKELKKAFKILPTIQKQVEFEEII